MTDIAYLKNLREASVEEPLRLMMSACLAGLSCGYDGSSYGDYPLMRKIAGYPTAKVLRFCPEDFSFGTPREMCDIHGGEGLDVLEGRARVITESGKDWTEGMVRASERMLELARRERIELAILMDISAACGSQVIYAGNRFAGDTPYRIGAGVCAAQLRRHGFRVICQRDHRSLELLLARLDPGHAPDPSGKDHHESDWYTSYFGS